MTIDQHTPIWNSPTPATPMDADALAQFLALHGAIPVYQGTPVYQGGTVISGDAGAAGFFEGWQSLNSETSQGFWLDQEFTMPSGQTTIGSIALPISQLQLPVSAYPAAAIDYAGPPLAGTEFEYATDVTLSLYTDSAGALGTLLAQVTLPKEVIEALATGDWPEPQPTIVGPVCGYSQASVLTSVYEFQALTAGQVLVAYAANLSSQSVYLSIANDGLPGPWLNGTELPFVPDGLQCLAYSPTNTVLLSLGGQTSAGYISSVYSASLDQAGNMGNWQIQQPLPTACLPLATAVVTVGGADFVYIIGFDASAGLLPTVYWAEIETNGSITTWNTSSFPAPAGVGTTALLVNPLNCPVINGTLYVFIGNSNTDKGNIMMMTPNDDGSPGTWIAAEQTSIFEMFQLAEGPGGLFALNGAHGYSAWGLSSIGGIGPNQVGVISSQPPTSGSPPPYAGAWVVPQADGTYAFLTSTEAGLAPSSTGFISKAYPVTWANVPMPITGLTAGNVYHLVISTAKAPNKLAGSNVALVGVPLNVQQARYSTNGGSTWTTLAFDQVPFQIFNGDAGPLLALVEDWPVPAAAPPAKVTYLWYDQPSIQLLDIAEWAGTTRAATVLGYNDDGTLAVIVDLE